MDNNDMKELDSILIDLIEALKKEKNNLKEEYGRTNKKRGIKIYTKNEENAISKLLIETNTLISVINYIRTKDEKQLENIDYRKKV